MSGCMNITSPYIMSNKSNTILNEEQHQQHFNLSPPNPININTNSIRRSLSADMSSPKWVQNNGFPMKKLQSSEDLQSLAGEELDDKKSGSGSGAGAAFEDIWSSILSQKKPEETASGDPVSVPYVHPLVKRASSLSEKSLEICTESLGSETGSDGFSFTSTDRGEENEGVEDDSEVVEEVKNDHVEVVKYNFGVSNKKEVNASNGVVRSFPPPLPSLANRDDGSNLQMRTHRQDGRLVVEAVSVPSRNCFRACREDGRLLLTLTNDNVEEEQEVFDDEEMIEDVEENVEEVIALVMEENSCMSSTKMINVNKESSAMIMTKLMELTSSRNMSMWPRSSNMAVISSLDEGADDMLVEKTTTTISPTKVMTHQMLPPRPRMSTTTSAADVLNAYEYYWRRSDSPTAAAVAMLKPLAGKQNISGATAAGVSPQVIKHDTNNNNNNRINKLLLGHDLKEEVVIVKAATVGGEYLVPILRGCKEPKRSLFFLEPFCIATS